MIHVRTRVCIMQNAHTDVREKYACLGVTRAHERAVCMALYLPMQVSTLN